MKTRANRVLLLSACTLMWLHRLGTALLNRNRVAVQARVVVSNAETSFPNRRDGHDGINIAVPRAIC
jgi:hypothetical protein